MGGRDGAPGVVLAACVAVATPVVRPAADGRAGCRAEAAAGVRLLGGGASKAGCGMGGYDGALSAVLAACVAAATPEARPAAGGRAGCRAEAAAGVLPLGGGTSEHVAARAATTAR